MKRHLLPLLVLLPLAVLAKTQDPKPRSNAQARPVNAQHLSDADLQRIEQKYPEAIVTRWRQADFKPWHGKHTRRVEAVREIDYAKLAALMATQR